MLGMPVNDDFKHEVYSVSHSFTAASERKVKQVQLDGSTFFVAFKLIHEAGNTDYQSKLAKNSRDYSDQLMDSLNMWGIATLPHRLIDPIVLPPSVTFFIEAINGTTLAANTVKWALQGVRVYSLEEGEKIARKLRGDILTRDPVEVYSYVLDLTLNANERNIVTIQIQGDADFVCRHIIGNSTGDFSARIKDSATRRSEWDDNLIAKDLFIGTAQYPNDIHPRKLIRNSTVELDAQDLSGAGNRIQVVLEGFKHPGIIPAEGV